MNNSDNNNNNNKHNSTTSSNEGRDVSKAVKNAVLLKSNFDAANGVACRGHNFSEVSQTGKVDYDKLFDSFLTTGFQATSFGQAVQIIREMVKKTTKKNNQQSTFLQHCLACMEIE